jgi:SAM-dependent methyltransferase
MLHVPYALRRGAEKSEESSIDEGVWLIEHMCSHLGVADLGQCDVLDFGCGVKFTQAFINRRLPIRRYVGVDVDREVIEFLETSVDDERFEFHRLDAHNALYNPDGEVLSEHMRMPIDGQFDVICLFSVFTHLAPHDYVAMLRLLRRFVKPAGQLFFTLFVNERTESGLGLIDSFSAMLERPESGVDFSTSPSEPEDFSDLNPQDPLRWAVYSRKHALELVDGTGWNVEGLFPPDAHLQHHMVCRPE